MGMCNLLKGILNPIDNQYKTVIAFRNIAVFMGRQYFDFVKAEYVDERGELNLRTLRDNFVSAPVEMLALKVIILHLCVA